jgi:hypothetical protein
MYTLYYPLFNTVYKVYKECTFVGTRFYIIKKIYGTNNIKFNTKFCNVDFITA